MKHPLVPATLLAIVCLASGWWLHEHPEIVTKGSTVVCACIIVAFSFMLFKAFQPNKVHGHYEVDHMISSLFAAIVVAVTCAIAYFKGKPWDVAQLIVMGLVVVGLLMLVDLTHRRALHSLPHRREDGDRNTDDASHDDHTDEYANEQQAQTPSSESHGRTGSSVLGQLGFQAG